MKEIVLHPEDVNNINFNYDHDGPKISFCSPPDRYNRIRVVNYFDTCRETITNFLRSQFVKQPKVKKNIIDTKKVRLLFYFKIDEDYKSVTVDKITKLYDSNMLKALKIVNHIEKKHRWGRTNLQKISHKNPIKNRNGNDISDRTHLYMFVGSNRWLKSPQMLSLYMLLLRIPHWKFKAKFETYEEFIKELADFSSGYSTDYDEKMDKIYVKQLHDKLNLLLVNYNKLFGGRTLESFYNRASYAGDSGSNEGIYKLCIGKSVDTDLNKRFKALCNKNKIKIETKGSGYF